MEVSTLKAQLGEALNKIDQLVTGQEQLRINQEHIKLQCPPPQRNRQKPQRRKATTYQPKHPNKPKTAPQIHDPPQRWMPTTELYPCLPGSFVPSHDRQWAWVVKSKPIVKPQPTETHLRKEDPSKKANACTSATQEKTQSYKPPRQQQKRQTWQYRPKEPSKYRAIHPPVEAQRKVRNLGKKPMLEITFPSNHSTPRRNTGVVITELE